VAAVDLSQVQLCPELNRLIPRKLALKHGLVAIERKDQWLTVATPDPEDLVVQDEARLVIDQRVMMVRASREQVQSALANLYPGSETDGPLICYQPDDLDLEPEHDTLEELLGDSGWWNPGDLESLVSGAIDKVEVVHEKEDDGLISARVDAPVIRLVNVILLSALKMRASDIHIEPYERAVRIRYRIDGRLRRMMLLPKEIKKPVIARIKVMSHLDLAERRHPQDGRIRLKIHAEKSLDFRVATIPTLHGEKVVLRLLDRSNLSLDLERLGFNREGLQEFRWAIRQPWGMILVTGPTGSGKTTTLYSALSELNHDEINIMCVEDPVEYHLAGINQVQTHERVGLGFASALRSFLRHDPDVIMVGEIRDYDTADIAIKAALTGHLVFSTLHTNDAPSAVIRLIDMGLEPFLIASSLQLVLAQRLVRRLCPDCRRTSSVGADFANRLGIDADEPVYESTGCSHCQETGYMGRKAFFEVMPVRREMREAIGCSRSYELLRDLALEQGMRPMVDMAAQALRAGVISIKEAVHVAKDHR